MTDTTGLLPPGFRLAGHQECMELHLMQMGPVLPAGRLQDILRPLSWESRFAFKCQRCGNCCLLRNPAWESLTRAATIRVLDYCMRYDLPPPGEYRGRNTVPAREAGGPCLWIGRESDGRFSCRVQPVKPFLCALAPVGFLIDHVHKVVAISMSTIRGKRGFCKGMDRGKKTHVVGDWCRRLGLHRCIMEADDEWHHNVRVSAPAEREYTACP